MAIVGYARVSTNGQTLEIQHEALKAAGCAKVYAEKLSGARADNRPQLDRMLKALRHGDMVVVTRLDRLARSTRDLLNILDQVTAAGALFKSLADAWCDTTTAHGKLLITILGGLAEFERSLILARTNSGIERARNNGVTFGRPAKLNARQRQLAAERYAAGETMAAIARELEVSEATISRALSAG
jgi:DNA invertase Pin-like site-specific DNA recombinase